MGKTDVARPYRAAIEIGCRRRRMITFDVCEKMPQDGDDHHGDGSGRLENGGVFPCVGRGNFGEKPVKKRNLYVGIDTLYLCV